MYHIKDDQRSIRSAEMLYTGLAKLITQQPFNTIKVKDLVEVSRVGRTTFYRNFDDIEDILRLRSDQVFEGLIAYLVAYTQQHSNESPTSLLKPTLRYFYLHSEILELLMSAKRLDIAQSSFRRVVEPFKVQALTLFDIEEEFIEYVITIRLGIVTNIMLHWIKTGKKPAPDELADRLGVIIEKMVTLDQLL